MAFAFSLVRQLRKHGPGILSDCLLAAWELARAHRRFHDLSQSQLVALVPEGSEVDPLLPLTARDRRIVQRIAVAIPGVALRVPWRADCMVQAMAARRWLARAGIGSTMKIGVRRDVPDGFGAHAWLTVGDTVVTGGDIAPYQPLEILPAVATTPS